MTKHDSYLSERNYEIWTAEKLLEQIEEGMLYDKTQYKHICLYKYSFRDMTDEMFSQLDKWYEQEMFLKDVLKGKKQLVLARLCYRYIKRKEDII